MVMSSILSGQRTWRTRYHGKIKAWREINAATAAAFRDAADVFAKAYFEPSPVFQRLVRDK